MKQKLFFKCTSCNYQPPKWVGCCPECSEWETVVEVAPLVKRSKRNDTDIMRMVPLSEISLTVHKRMLSGIDEWDRVIGGGIMPGSFLILTGDPGIGKSTLLLSVAHRLSQNRSVFYFSSEESLEQVKLRAIRLGCDQGGLLLSDAASLEDVVAVAQEKKADLIVIDSIQNCYTHAAQSVPGTMASLREAAFQLMRLAKEHNIAVIVTSHITKEGAMAGPKLFEHMVDAVFYLQGEDRWRTRVLRSVKNRFGGINELGFFEMNETGLQEVNNINEELLNQTTFSEGSALISYIEGSRPLMVELQALTIASKYGIPQRCVTGLDQKRVVLIAAIIEKYLGIKLSAHDIFFNVGGGFKLKGSSSDLGVALALLSSYFECALPARSIALGELSLTGHIKPVNHISMHISEADKFGIERLFVSKGQKIEKLSAPVTYLYNVYDLLNLFVDQKRGE